MLECERVAQEERSAFIAARMEIDAGVHKSETLLIQALAPARRLLPKLEFPVKDMSPLVDSFRIRLRARGDVMPHRATRRAMFWETRTTPQRNSGLYSIHTCMYVKLLKQELQRSVKVRHDMLLLFRVLATPNMML